ncbi:MAG: glycosyl hydrolase [Chitinophagaceae bacterium]
MKRIVTIFLLIILAGSNLIAQRSSLITVKDQQFILQGQPCYFIGTNYWYGGLLPLEKDKSKGIDRLRKELDFLKANGVTNLRVLAGSEGKGIINGHPRVGPPIQSQQGVFDPNFLKGMDAFLNESEKRKMTAVIYLSNNWNWSGGFPQYLQWNNKYPDSVFLKEIPWDKMGAYNSKFYDCEKCMAGYYAQVKYVISHTNSINRKKYSEDPAIMAWEIANEPRPMHPSARSSYKKFIRNAAAYIKQLDPNHLVTTGTEGYQSTQGMPLYREINDDKNIDYLTIHIWPKNWGWLNIQNFTGSIDSVITKTNRYLNEHEAVANELNKPMVVEEFGLPRDKQSFDKNSTTRYRDIYYSNMLNRWLDSKRYNGNLAGINFWAYGGIGKTTIGQTWWKEGDPYLGDPPLEEQGLNTVFNSDKSTWKIVDSVYKASLNTQAAAYLPVDKNATSQTINLYHNLKKLVNKGVMFGHQDDLAYGVNWKYVPSKSDVKDVAGDYPAVYGFELGRLELDHPVNIDSVPFDKMRGFIKTAYQRGGIVTLSWHLNNPLTGKTSWDPAPGTVASILPDGVKNELYKSWLDKVAKFIVTLKDKNGVPIPVILRLFHELNGNWFWWGKEQCTPEEFRQLWYFTISYLRDTKNIHQLLYAFNTDRFLSEEDYLIKYPGNEWVDVLGFDIYQRKGGSEGNKEFIHATDTMLTMLTAITSARNKIPALTEFGYGKVPDSTWWTQVFLKALNHHKISYAMAWRNAGLKSSGEIEYYVPYKGQESEKDFIKFSKEPEILFQKDINYKMVYE